MKKFFLLLLILGNITFAGGTSYVDDYILGLITGLPYKCVSEDADTVALSIHDISENYTLDAWYYGNGMYGANPGEEYFLAHWNLDIYLIPEFTGYDESYEPESFSGITLFETTTIEPVATLTFISEDLSYTYTELFKIYSFDSVATGDSYHSINFADSNTDLTMFDPYAVGKYTITIVYGDVTNSIEVYVGMNPPAVPAPGALLLSGLGTVLFSRLKRKFA